MTKLRLNNFVLIQILVLLLATPPALAADFDSEQKEMVVELTRLGIKNKKVLSAFGSVPRHKFTPRKNLRLSYLNKSFPIEGGRRLYQPYELAKMAELLKPGPGKKVLQIGVGSGYEAAILSKVFSQVYIIETVKVNADSIKALPSFCWNFKCNY